MYIYNFFLINNTPALPIQYIYYILYSLHLIFVHICRGVSQGGGRGRNEEGGRERGHRCAADAWLQIGVADRVVRGCAVLLGASRIGHDSRRGCCEGDAPRRVRRARETWTQAARGVGRRRAIQLRVPARDDWVGEDRNGTDGGCAADLRRGEDVVVVVGRGRDGDGMGRGGRGRTRGADDAGRGHEVVEGGGGGRGRGSYPWRLDGDASQVCGGGLVDHDARRDGEGRNGHVTLEGSVHKHDGARVSVVVVLEVVVIADVTDIVITVVVVFVVEGMDIHRFRVVLLVTIGVVDELLPVTEVLQEVVGAYEEVLDTIPTSLLVFHLNNKENKWINSSEVWGRDTYTLNQQKPINICNKVVEKMMRARYNLPPARSITTTWA